VQWDKTGRAYVADYSEEAGASRRYIVSRLETLRRDSATLPNAPRCLLPINTRSMATYYKFNIRQRRTSSEASTMSHLAATTEIGLIELPAPQLDQASPLLQVLSKRHSSREFSSRALPLEVLSTLLWAAFGINRPETAGRTAPSAHNWQEIAVFAVLADGAYRYDAATNVLRLARAGDLRALTGVQDFVGGAPLDLVYVADFAKMGDATDEQRTFYASADAAVIAQNVYFFCACTGLATVVRGLVDRRKLAPALGLGSHERIVLAQTVGYPAR
jgi:nitroreductase